MPITENITASQCEHESFGYAGDQITPAEPEAAQSSKATLAEAEGAKIAAHGPCNWSELIRTDTLFEQFPVDAIGGLLAAAIDSLLLTQVAENAEEAGISTRYGGVCIAAYLSEAAKKIADGAEATPVASACDEAVKACWAITRVINEDLEEEGFPSAVTLPVLQHAIDKLRAADEATASYSPVSAAA